MTSGQLNIDDATPRRDDLCYLDTSVLFPLALAKQPRPGRQEQEEANRVKTFLTRAKAAGARTCSSVLALEEIAAKITGGQRKPVLIKHACTDWYEFKRTKPGDAEAAAAEIRSKVDWYVSTTVAEASQLGVAFLHPCLPEPKGEDPLQEHARLRKNWKKLLLDHPAIDPMDALHMVYGTLLLAACFVSLDRAWRDVKTITVIGRR